MSMDPIFKADEYDFRGDKIKLNLFNMLNLLKFE